MKITPEIRTYAMNIAAVGNRMQQTGNRFGEISDDITRDTIGIREAKGEYLILLQEFKQQEKTLLKQNVPSALKTEHDRLVNSFGKYVEATNLMISSLNVEIVTVNESLYEEAKSLQGTAAKEIVQTTQQMAIKLGI
ncbi:hypothetical protein H7992_09550 [Sporosarcina sp. resist]|uniref:hypothetical protein n=1 Tax=Sporosarcina sp. resist TaxID=2762563 RepID=UPI00164DADA2|nr:hypothetical protein [Sporosarcina sp. resist]QNK89863.1 hypothetical protein H7992_09550 [Sporosarcina sp. resist]